MCHTFLQFHDKLQQNKVAVPYNMQAYSINNIQDIYVE